MDDLKFSEFISLLKNQLEQPLPGEMAQFKMAPVSRKTRDVALKLHPNPKNSAILVLLYPQNSKIKTVLMERNAYKGVHSKQISFPGGRVESQDKNLMATALREFEEEVGVPQQKITIIGELTQLFIPPSGYLVNPFVGYVDFEPVFIPEEKEVADLIFPTIDELADTENLKTGTFLSGISGIIVKAPYYRLHEKQVWGATAMIISELNAIIENIKSLHQ